MNKHRKFVDRLSCTPCRSLLRRTFWASGVAVMLSSPAFASYVGEDADMEKTSSPHSVTEIFLQQKEIKGIVRASDSGLPLAGVTVRIVGKSAVTSTDENGAFSIEAALNDEIEFDYIGYKANRIKVLASTSDLTIDLQASEGSLEEVVVTGYGTQRKKDLTGSVAIVNVSELKAQPAASAVEALQGKATGVQIVNDGAPGSTPQIKIRGFSTINNNEPLYIIDGVPFEGKLSWLNQNDIETMQVLKDASAASIYGARANNGVVIITTKTGRKGSKPQISIDAYVGAGVPNRSRFPKMITPQQLFDLQNASPTYTGDKVVMPEYLIAGSVYGTAVTPTDADMSKYNYSLDNADAFYQITKANSDGTDWFDALSQNAPVQSYQLSATGGGENASYAMSLGYLNQQGSVIHSGFKRYNIRSNSGFSAFDNRIRFGENFQYSFTQGVGMGVNPNVAGSYMDEGSILGFAYRIHNIIPVYDEGGNYAGSKGGWGNGQNPVAMAYRAKDNINKSNFFFGNVFAEADILKSLTFRTSLGIRYENYTGTSYTYPNPEFAEGSFNNGMSEYFGYTNEWTWTNTLNYKPDLGENHTLNILAGTEAIENKWRQLDGSRNGFFTMSSLDYLYLNAGTTNFGNVGTGTVGAMFSIFAKADYSFLDRYILSATVRRDGSSNFGDNNKYGVFPGFSAAWRISEEEFVKSWGVFTDLKIRAGYGVTGNQRIPSDQYANIFEQSANSSSYPIDGTVTPGIWQQSYANLDVKWEQVKALNLGLDFTLFDGDVDGAFDYYDKKTTDMLYRLPLPAAAVGRAEAPYVNIGSMSNKGVEFSLGYHYGRRQEAPFTLDASATISRNVNKVDELAPSVNQHIYGSYRSMNTSILREGEVFGAFYGFDVIGIYQDDNDIANSASYEKARIGGFKYRDLNNNGTIDDDDRVIIGDPHPDFVYSLNLNAGYKNFDLALNFYGSQGNDLYEATRYYTDFNVFSGSKSVRVLDGWSPTNTGSMTPSINFDPNGSSREYESSSYYVQDGSFFKLKNLQLGYNVPVQKLFGENSYFSKGRVYFGVSNVFTITKYEGLDPEVSATPSTYPALGVDFGVYPQARQYLFGISLGF